jgi:protein-S-isoprenylcysteine O-methyltransferase Ste14
MDPRVPDAKGGHRGDALRPYRQDGLPDPAVRPLLLLSRVRRRIRPSLVSTQRFFDSEAAAWVGVCLCLAGVIVVLFSLVSFGRSCRVGIDSDHPDKLVTTGVFFSTPTVRRGSG